MDADIQEYVETANEISEVDVCSEEKIGILGEKIAALFLERRGYEIVEKNYRCVCGEADIIALDEGTLVLVEVKTRRGAGNGFPEESVTATKRKKYENIAALYLADHDVPEAAVRFDVIGILVVRDNRALLRHHVNAFMQGNVL